MPHIRNYHPKLLCIIYDFFNFDLSRIEISENIKQLHIFIR